jgi:hypothetical protein
MGTDRHPWSLRTSWPAIAAPALLFVGSVFPASLASISEQSFGIGYGLVTLLSQARL